MIILQHICILILVFCLSCLLSFACAFTATSLYIHWKRRPVQRYHFTEPAEPRAIRRDTRLDSDLPTGVDGASARWNK